MSSSTTERHPRVVPAHLSYLAIYNPSLGRTDDTVADQIVFYHSPERETLFERPHKAQHSGHNDDPREQKQEEDAKREEKSEQNERLRQVGLAQGMVDFVKNFSDGVPFECIEAEKSRVVLKEVEPQWWILASIELTQLPAGNTANVSAKKRSASLGKEQGNVKATGADAVEYSSREVAPSQLLLSQILQAHRIFLLHHASSLSELWEKHADNRKLFCALLERYWTRFIWNWDVLLHGNPAVELYDGIKLAGGGELGIGVGEEEWGSGEREVLEGFAHRTEGLLDLIVGRYGDAPLALSNDNGSEGAKSAQIPKSPEPWLGNGEASNAQDGIIFSGIGGSSRRSLATISQWMEAIFTQGEDAYGVGENPASRPKNRRKRRRVINKRSRQSADPQYNRTVQQQREESHPRTKSPHTRALNLRRKAIENNATPPGIPAPLVSAVERSLDDATTGLSVGSSHKSLGEEKPETEATEVQTTNEITDSPLFGTEKMMKYLSLGYGSSWTLNPKGFTSSSRSQDSKANPPPDASAEDDQAEENLQRIEPTPEVSDEDEEPFVQRLEQSIGKFLIGLSGDLENTEFEEDDLNDIAVEPSTDPASGSSAAQNTMHRIFLRTLTIEMSSTRFSQVTASKIQTSGDKGVASNIGDETGRGEDKTSAAASVDGSSPIVKHERVQVVVYVHQPFIFIFLFELRTSKLTLPAFYRSIHHTLGPLQKSLLRSTDSERWRERMRETLGMEDVVAGHNPQPSLASAKDPLEIHDLIYDPITLTIRTSIPNIPVPGTLAAEGLHRLQQTRSPVTVSGSWYTLGIPIGSFSASGASSPSAPSGLVKSDWTRIEALNIYTHILNVWATTRCRRIGIRRTRAGLEETERSIKTSRGWWVVWMRIKARKQAPDSAGESASQPNASERTACSEDEGLVKEAFLVRRSPQERTSTGRDLSGIRDDSRSTSSAGRWLLREQPRSRDVSGSGGISSLNSTTTNAKAVGEGVGIDARKWVEGLVKLSM